MGFRPLLILPVSVLLFATAFADFRYVETTRISGGAIVGTMRRAGALNREAREAMEPTTFIVLVKGNRMIRINSIRSEIIDLDLETITNLDHQRRQYSVTTFQQLKQQLEDAQPRLQRDQTAADKTPPMNFNVAVRNPGARKTIAGLSTSEFILSLTMADTDPQSLQAGAMAITNDMWLGPEIPGYAEVRDFNRRMAVKLGRLIGGALPPSISAMQAGSAQGMAELAKEMARLKGVPVVQILRMGTTVNGKPLPAASESPLPPLPLGRRKHPDAQAGTAASAAAGLPVGPGVLMETTIEMTSFSTRLVDPARFNVPAAYKEVAGR